MYRYIIILFFMLWLVGCSANYKVHTPFTSKVAEGMETIRWTSCPRDIYKVNQYVECGELLVPQNYNDPDGNYIPLFITRVKSGSKTQTKTGKITQKKGVIIISPGGPGSSAIKLFMGFIRITHHFPDRLMQQFDLIAFEPRGIGRSSKVYKRGVWADTIVPNYSNPSCKGRLQKLMHSAQVYSGYDIINKITTDLKNRYTTYQACVKNSNLMHLGAMNVFEDMERLRRALGEQQLNYIGFSYGTRIGELYAMHYPQHTRSFILDAPVSNDTTSFKLYTYQMPFTYKQFEKAWQQFCKTMKKCPTADEFFDKFLILRQKGIQGDQKGVYVKAYDKLFNILVNILVSGGDKKGEHLQKLHNWFYDSASFLQTVSQNVEDSNMENSNNAQAEEQTKDEAPFSDYYTFSQANVSIFCLDTPYTNTKENILTLYNRTEKWSKDEFFAGLSIDMLSRCFGFPASNLAIPSEIHQNKTPKVLLVSGTNDKQANPLWSETLSKSMNSLLITSDHKGHGVLFGINNGQFNNCLDKIATGFLIDNTLPKAKKIACKSSPIKAIAKKANTDISKDEDLIKFVKQMQNGLVEE